MESNTTKNNLISILICSRDRRLELEHLVAFLKRMISIHPFEIIVVEETDSPQPIEGVTYVAHPSRNFGIPYARNLALKKASGYIIIFVDDDVTPSEDWFVNLLNPFKDDNVGAVGGVILPDLSNINLIGKCISFLGFPAGGLERYIRANRQCYETNLISTGNCAFRKDLAHKISGFDSLLRWGGEDQEFFSRMNLISKTLFNPKALVFHKQRNSIKDVFLWFIRRGKADFYRKCKVNHPLCSLIFPLRSNFFLKLASFFLIFSGLLLISSFAAIVIALLVPIIWTVILWQRSYKVFRRLEKQNVPGKINTIKNAILSKEVKYCLGCVKLTMDLGYEIGRLVGFYRYLKHRLFLKPFILNFHNLESHKTESDSLNSKYYFSKEQFETIIEDSRLEGWVIVSFFELIQRLKENPNSLYFEKIFCVTFDDAYQSIFSPLTELSSKGNLPFMIFVPTGLVGDSNLWDQEKGLKREKIINWEQIEILRAKGIEIGSHTRHHINLLESDTSTKKVEILGSITDLKNHLLNLNRDRIVFSYPYGSYNQDIIRAIKDAGYIGAAANFKGNIRPTTDPYQIPRFTVFADSDWGTITKQSRSIWAKELLKDIRDNLFRR